LHRYDQPFNRIYHGVAPFAVPSFFDRLDEQVSEIFGFQVLDVRPFTGLRCSFFSSLFST
jgi:hypothetical protein